MACDRPSQCSRTGSDLRFPQLRGSVTRDNCDCCTWDFARIDPRTRCSEEIDCVKREDPRSDRLVRPNGVDQSDVTVLDPYRPAL